MAINRKTYLKGRIDYFTVKGFRSLENIEKMKLPDLAIIIGSNGSGKSNCIKFFEMLNYMLRGENLTKFVNENGGADDQLFMGSRQTPRLQAEIRIETALGYNDYVFSLTHASSNSGGRLMFVDERFRYSSRDIDGEADWVTLDTGNYEANIVEYIQNENASDSAKKTADIVVNLLKNCATYQFHDTSKHSFLKQDWDVTENIFLKSHGGNLSPILFRLKQGDIKRYKMIVRQIRRVLPTFDDFELEPFRGKIALRWKHNNGDKTIGAHLTSDGSLRLFCLITLLNLPRDMLPDILFLDEPELGLHPHAITLIAEMLTKVSLTQQVFIATQSPYLVDCFDLENIIVADLKDGATQLRTFDREMYQQWMNGEYQVSDLWLKDVVGTSS